MSSTYTPPDYAAWLTVLDQQIAKMNAGATVASYTIAGMTFTKRSLADVLEHRERILGMYNREQAGGNVVLADQSEGTRRGVV